ncbi:hypothetical protein L218DRAFT_459793 [Marasmius fiardii PR-910]|nr:hypothetical protein L218DRAFT_459793 [Marasmius fiardii PR-910]
MATNLPPGAAPPAAPSPDHQHVQFASYPSPATTNNVTIAPLQRSTSPRSSNESDPKEHDRNKVINSTSAKVWTPLPLRPIFYIPYILFLILLAAALEIAFHFSQKNTGFRVHGDPDALGKQSGVWHYIYTLPLVALAMFIVGIWAWTDIEIKKLQPYVDLAQGNSPPHRSLLLDYTRHHNFLVWMPALSNKHYTVLLASLLAIISLAFQPLAAALLEVRDIWWSLPVRGTPVNTVLGLSGGIGDVNTPVGDMSVFLSASGYAAATALYSDLPKPAFVAVATDGSGAGWTVMDVKIPPELPRNGTTLALNATAVKTLVNCRSTPVNMTQTNAATGAWTNVIQDQATGCGLTFNVNRTGPNLFGTNVAICSNQGQVQTNPVIFWFFTYQPQARASATICQPTIQLFDVTTTLRLDGPSTSTSPLDGETLGGGDVVSVVQKGTFDLTKSPFAGSAGNLSALINPSTGTIPAFNGLDWDASLSSNDSSIRNRLLGIQFTMPSAIFQAATAGGVGVQGAFGSDR